tara:strand:- start:159 stop:404 length:246 start_codon:yes stop_codon:yes gene_type:complete
MTEPLSFEEAEKVGLVAQEECMGGFTPTCREERTPILYRITDGMYAGFIYCKECMIKHLADSTREATLNWYRRMLEKGEMI